MTSAPLAQNALWYESSARYPRGGSGSVKGGVLFYASNLRQAHANADNHDPKAKKAANLSYQESEYSLDFRCVVMHY